MKFTLIFILPFLLYSHSACAALIPYLNMDTLIFKSSDVVLGEEVEFLTENRKNQYGHTYKLTVAKYKVVRVFKGNLKETFQVTVELNEIYTRWLADEAFVLPREKYATLPKGKALLFLYRDGDVLRPVTPGVKLIIKDTVYCYGQFVTNPGPLWLKKMQPENIEMEEDQAYGEDLLIKDLLKAFQRVRDKNFSQKRMILGGDPFERGDPLNPE